MGTHRARQRFPEALGEGVSCPWPEGDPSLVRPRGVCDHARLENMKSTWRGHSGREGHQSLPVLRGSISHLLPVILVLLQAPQSYALSSPPDSSHSRPNPPTTTTAVGAEAARCRDRQTVLGGGAWILLGKPELRVEAREKV